MDATRETKIEEFDQIRLLVTLKGANVFDDNEIHTLPAGSEGTVVALLGEGKAFEVEFLIWANPEIKDDNFISVQIPVEANQCELAHKAA